MVTRKQFEDILNRSKNRKTNHGINWKISHRYIRKSKLNIFRSQGSLNINVRSEKNGKKSY